VIFAKSFAFPCDSDISLFIVLHKCVVVVYNMEIFQAVDEITVKTNHNSLLVWIFQRKSIHIITKVVIIFLSIIFIKFSLIK